MCNRIKIATNVLFKIQKVWFQMLLALILSVTFPVYAANMPDAQEPIQLLGIQQQDLASLEQGETISFEVVETNEKELAGGVAISICRQRHPKLSDLSRIKAWHP